MARARPHRRGDCGGWVPRRRAALGGNIACPGARPAGPTCAGDELPRIVPRVSRLARRLWRIGSRAATSASRLRAGRIGPGTCAGAAWSSPLAYFWSTGAPRTNGSESGSPTDDRGTFSHDYLIVVRIPTLRLPAIAIHQGPASKAGVFAVRAARLPNNLRGSRGEPLTASSPRALLALLSAERHAMGVLNCFSWEGGCVAVKYRIDRRFIARYRRPRSALVLLASSCESSADAHHFTMRFCPASPPFVRPRGARAALGMSRAARAAALDRLRPSSGNLNPPCGFTRSEQEPRR